MTLPRKDKACRVCKKIFTPQYNAMGQICCSLPCAIEQSRQKQQEAAEKAQRKRDANTKDRLKTRSERLRLAQSAVNAYVRLRDAGKPCISCGKPDDGSHQRHASHYRSVKAASCLRFNLRNIFTSCAQCNTMKSGNLLEYRMNLVNTRGHDYVDWLECQNYTVRYDPEYLDRLKRIFNRRVRQIKKRRGL